ncbi:MAG: geranylgeranylglycerol-phosphate geranylgeranyltransferase [Niabella sp.]|nr:geranylgeranylglycerol-phosphate geranylgeranyltransferase [Niabella sp.]
MQTISSFFKLIRWPNLLIIFLTQLLFEYCIIHPILEQQGMPLAAGSKDFLIIVFSFQLIAAAGYIINDWYDLPLDRVNKPQKVYISRTISKSAALLVYFLMNAVALLLVGFVSGSREQLFLLVCILLCELLLFFYSAWFKKRFLIGNLIVAVITASAIPVLLLPVGPTYLFTGNASGNLLQLTLLYTGFAFLITFVREVVKDLEDEPGDRMYGCHTMPIILGAKSVHRIAGITVVVLVLVISMLQPFLWKTGMKPQLLSLYSIALVLVPLGFIAKRIFKNAATVKEYHQLSSNIKIVMLTGILSMLFFLFINVK